MVIKDICATTNVQYDVFPNFPSVRYNNLTQHKQSVFDFLVPFMLQS